MMSEFRIDRRQLYILPTRIGWYFALILVALFAIAVKFDNQAAFMMLFILISVGLISMIHTHNNVIGLEFNSQPPQSVFVGATASFPITVHNNSNRDRRSIWLLCDGFQQLFNLPTGNQKQINLRLPTVKRGYLNCSLVNLTSHYPLGLFFCWSKRTQIGQRCLVYPQPLDLMPLPDSDHNSSQQLSTSVKQSSSEDYSGMKPYQTGDRLRDIHWPSFAKTQQLVTIQHEDQSGNSINLSWFSLPDTMNIEDRLSQLCHWVLEANRLGLRYQLEMPNHTIEFDNGLAHYHKCLSVLALWGDDAALQDNLSMRNNKAS